MAKTENFFSTVNVIDFDVVVLLDEFIELWLEAAYCKISNFCCDASIADISVNIVYKAKISLGILYIYFESPTIIFINDFSIEFVGKI